MPLPFWKSPPRTLLKERTFQVNYKQEYTDEFLLTYPSNFIKTSRYTALSFLPVCLLSQFRRYANIYFLFVAIIQSLPLSPLNPFSAIAPLVFVLGLSMLREGFEDLSRHKSDRETNATPTTSIKNKQNVDYTWADVRVGDLIITKQDEMFPADIIVLQSAIESGACYIETSSLDGEKNLKPRSALKEIQSNYENVTTVTAAKPLQSLTEFEGSVKYKGKNLVMGPKQLLLRGAFLRNTKWTIGVVVYTGEDTKVMFSSKPGRIKQSNIEAKMNSLIIGILILQLVCCTVSAICCSWWINNRGIPHNYIWNDDLSPALESFSVFFSYFLLYNTMIPISLIVSLEFVKVFQAYFIEKDEDMYVASRDKYVKAQTSTINEELGQVEYIFSDKTGTLTCNQMEFKYCIIGNIFYGKKDTEIIDDIVPLDQEDIELNNEPQKQQKNEEEEKLQLGQGKFSFEDKELFGILQKDEKYNKSATHPVHYRITSSDESSSLKITYQKELIHEYLFLLSSAHECLVEETKDKELKYQGPSPDEITLVDAAMKLGYAFKGASASQQIFSILGQDKKIELLKMFEFDSTRKRMSVIIRDNGKIKLLIKGADNIIKQRLKQSDQPFLGFIEGKLDEFSKIGLRTLLMAMKMMSENEYKLFDEAYQKLADSKNRDKELNLLADSIERDLHLIGATAVEDKLQYQVPETIADLLKANIKVWMLTGDKMETAENIARSCKLIQGDMTVMRLSEKNEKKLMHKIVDCKATYDVCIKEKRKKSFIVEGESLAEIIGHNTMERQFVQMAQNCESVVCCRVTPTQKAKVVELIKNSLNKITLAIGDGANDVEMIKEAHIGIGLYGNEGMRAVQSSDFALGEFRCLWRLLLVHGHWSYIRVSEMILYFFYKNMIFTIPQFFFGFFSAFSGQTYFDDWYITFYNLFFTALPLIARATFDQDVNYKQLALDMDNKIKEKIEFLNKQEQYLKKKFPLLYFVGQNKTIFTIPNFLFWLGQGFIHGGLVFFFGVLSFDDEILREDGMIAGFSSVSISIFTAIIFIVDIKIALYTKFWTVFNFVSLFALSILVYFIYFIISNYLPGTYSEATPISLLGSGHFYLIIILLNTIVFLFDIVFNYVISQIYKTDVDMMFYFKKNFEALLQNVNKKEEIEDKILQIQNKKKEVNLIPQWGDSFFEEMVEAKQPKEQINSPANDQQFIQT